MPNTGIDLLWGVGGTPEGVISAAAIKCLGGRILGRLWPRDDDERKAAEDAGYDLDRVLDTDDLVGGDDVFFAATGVTDGDLLHGVRHLDDGTATTESLVMRSRSGTVRRVQATPRPREAARGHGAGAARYGLSRAPRAYAGSKAGKRSLVAGATGYIGASCSPAACASEGRERRARWRATPARPQDLAEAGCEVVPGDVLRREPRRGAARASRSPTTWCTRWGAGARATSPSATARGAENFAAAAADGRGASGSSTSAASPTEGSKHLESRHATAELPGSTRRPRHLPARRRRDRRRQRVLPHRSTTWSSACR